MNWGNWLAGFFVGLGLGGVIGVLLGELKGRTAIAKIRNIEREARANAIRAAIAEVHEMRVSSLWNANRYDAAVSGLLDRLERLESLAKGEEDDGPTKAPTS